MALDLGISLKVDTSSLKDAVKEVEKFKKTIDNITTAKNSKKGFDDVSAGVNNLSRSLEKSGKQSISILEKQKLIAKFLAGDFTKGEASILAAGKAAGLTNIQMKELENTLKQIFKLSGKNPFDDSVNPLRRLTAESEKLVNKMKVLRGETSLTAKQLEELTILQARAEASARSRGISGAALQSTINKSTREYIREAERVNAIQSQYNIELEKTKQKRVEEDRIQRLNATGIATSVKQQERLNKLVSDTALKSDLIRQGLSPATSGMIVRAVSSGASVEGPEVKSLIESRKAIESVKDANKKLAETSSAAYSNITKQQKRLEALTRQFQILEGTSKDALKPKQFEEMSATMERARQKAISLGKSEEEVTRAVSDAQKEYIRIATAGNTLEQQILDKNKAKRDAEREARKNGIALLKEEKFLREENLRTELKTLGLSDKGTSRVIRAQRSGVSGDTLKAYTESLIKEEQALAKSKEHKKDSAEHEKMITQSLNKNNKLNSLITKDVEKQLLLEKGYSKEFANRVTRYKELGASESAISNLFKLEDARLQKEKERLDINKSHAEAVRMNQKFDRERNKSQGDFTKQLKFSEIQADLVAKKLEASKGTISQIARMIQGGLSFDSTIVQAYLKNMQAVDRQVSKVGSTAKDVKERLGEMDGPTSVFKQNVEKNTKAVNRMLEETTRKAELVKQGLSMATAGAAIRLERRGASESDIKSFIESRKAIESVNEAKKKLKETSSATYKAIVDGNKNAKFHIDGLQAAVRAIIPGFGALSAVAVSATVVAGAIRMADAYRSLQERIKLLSKTEEGRLEIQNEIIRLSRENRTNLVETGNLYIRLQNAIEQLGGTQQATSIVTEAFGKTLGISKVSGQEAASSILQFSQALASGRLQGDEFRAIAEANPRLLRAIGDGANKTTAELRKMSSEGLLTTAFVSKALASQLSVLRYEFEQVKPSISQAFETLRTNTIVALGELDNVTGFTEGFAMSIQGLGESISRVTPSLISSVKSIKDSFSSASASVGGFIKDNIQDFQALTISIIGVAGVMATKYVASTALATTATGALSAATAVYIAAGGGLSGIMSVITATSTAATAAIVRKTGAMAAITAATLTYNVAGGGLAGVFAVITAGVAAATRGIIAMGAALLTNPFVIVAAGISAIAYAIGGDTILGYLDKLANKLMGVRNAAQDFSKGLETEILRAQQRVKILSDKQTKEEEKRKLLDQASRSDAISDMVKFKTEQLDKLKGLSDLEIKNEKEKIKKLEDILRDEQKLNIASVSGIKDKTEENIKTFALSNISQEYEARIQTEKKRFDFERDLIDRKLQYDLMSAGIAETEKQRLAENTYKEEKALLEEQKAMISRTAITATSEKEKQSQKDSIVAQKKVIGEKIKALDIDRQRTIAIAEIIKFGEAEKANAIQLRDIEKIRADVQEDLLRKQIEFNNQFKDPAILAGEQARLQIADKYTSKISEAQSEVNRLNKLGYSKTNIELERAQGYLDALKASQKELSEQAQKEAETRARYNQTLEAGFQRAIRNRQSDFNDLSRVSEGFMNGFYNVFDTSLENSVKNFKFKFGNVFKYIRDELKKILIQQLILKPIKMIVDPVITEMGKAMLSVIYQAAAKAFAKDTISSGIDVVSLGKSLIGDISDVFDSPLSGLSKISELFSKGFVGLENSIYNGFAGALNTVGITGGTNIALSTAGTAAAGLATGYGVNRLLAGGYQVGGTVGNISKNSALIGALFGPMGSIIGGAIGGAINGLFGKKVSQTTGIQGSVTSDGFTGKGFVETTTKRRFRSTKVDTQYSALNKDYENSLDSAIKSTFDGAKSLLKVLGTGSEAAIDSYVQSGRFFIRNTSELNSFLNTLSNSLLSRAIPSLKQFQKQGESLAQTGLRVANSLLGLNNLTKILGNITKFDFSNFKQGEKLVESLQSDDFKNAIDFYVENFADKADVFKAKSDSFNFQVTQLGMSLSELSSVSTKEDFTRLIKGIDLTTESSQKLLNSLLSLAPSLKEIIDLREQESESLERLKGFGKTIREFIDSVIFQNSSPTQNIASTQAEFQKVLALTASSSVDVRDEALRSIPEIARAYIDVAKQYFGSSSAYQDIQSQVLGALENLPAVISFDRQQASITPFANGGVFTNSVASAPTLAPMALFGESGSEAIMPLTRGPGGSLGVVSYGNSVDTSPLIRELCARVDNLTRVVQTYAKADLETSSEILIEQRSTAKNIRQAVESRD